MENINNGIPKHEDLLLKTTKKEALKIINFLVGYHEIKGEDLDLSE